MSKLIDEKTGIIIENLVANFETFLQLDTSVEKERDLVRQKYRLSLEEVAIEATTQAFKDAAVLVGGN